MAEPARHSWAQATRGSIAELLGLTLHYYVSGADDRTDAEYRELAILEQKIVLLLNPADSEHQALVKAIRAVVAGAEAGYSPDSDFPDTHSEVVAISRRMLARELADGGRHLGAETSTPPSITKPA